MTRLNAMISEPEPIAGVPTAHSDVGDPGLDGTTTMEDCSSSTTCANAFDVPAVSTTSDPIASATQLPPTPYMPIVISPTAALTQITAINPFSARPDAQQVCCSNACMQPPLAGGGLRATGRGLRAT